MHLHHDSYEYLIAWVLVPLCRPTPVLGCAEQTGQLKARTIKGV